MRRMIQRKCIGNRCKDKQTQSGTKSALNCWRWKTKIKFQEKRNTHYLKLHPTMKKNKWCYDFFSSSVRSACQIQLINFDSFKLILIVWNIQLYTMANCLHLTVFFSSSRVRFIFSFELTMSVVVCMRLFVLFHLWHEVGIASCKDAGVCKTSTVGKLASAY